MSDFSSERHVKIRNAQSSVPKTILKDLGDLPGAARAVVDGLVAEDDVFSWAEALLSDIDLGVELLVVRCHLGEPKRDSLPAVCNGGHDHAHHQPEHRQSRSQKQQAALPSASPLAPPSSRRWRLFQLTPLASLIVY
jgi:hypothetical protein